LFWKRLIIAIIFIPLLILSIWKGTIIFLGVVCFVVLTGLFEFFQAIEKGGNPFVREALFLGGLYPVLIYLKGEEIIPLFLLIIIFFIFLRQLLKFDPRNSFKSISLSLGGIIYIPFLFSFIILLREIPDWGTKLVITLFFVTWMGDSGAYFIGTKWGKHKSFSRLSPYKSFEGFIGGGFTATIAMIISRGWLPFSLISALFMGIMMGVMGEMGDLFSSMIKREVGIKDFGNILPGHGGILDRFDSLLFTTPLFYYFVKCYLVI